MAATNGLGMISCLASFDDLVNGDQQMVSCVSVAFDLVRINGEAGVVLCRNRICGSAAA